MPSPREILDGLTYIANTWVEIAVAWHITIAGLLAALLLGWRPTQRRMSLLLALPLVSVSVFAWLTRSPFNGTLFALGAIALGIVGARLPRISMQRASNPAALIGLATVAFGFVYPHFLEGGSAVRYLYAAPTGLVPCPTLSVVVGLALLADGLGSRAWSLMLAAIGLFYGLFGAFRLGVYLDIGLIVGATALAVVGLQAGQVRQTGSSAENDFIRSAALPPHRERENG
jgi:hypothetical protein